MSASIRNRKRGAPLLVAAGAIAMSALTISSDQQSGPASAAGGHGGAAAAQRSMIFIDPDTGLPREPTPEELLELNGRPARTLSRVSPLAAQPASEPVPIVSETGLAGLSLGDDQMTHVVATKAADGSIVLEHATGKHEAEQKVRDGNAPGGSVVRKERLLER